MLSRAALLLLPAKTGLGDQREGGIRCSGAERRNQVGRLPTNKLDLNQAVQDVRRMFPSYLPPARTGPAEAESSGT